MSSTTPTNLLQRKNSLRSGANQNNNNKSTEVGELKNEIILMITQLTRRIDLLEVNITAAIDNKIKNAVTSINNKIEDLNNKIDNVEMSLNKKIMDQRDEMQKITETNIAKVYDKINSVATEFNQSCTSINQRIDLVPSTDSNVINDVDDRLIELERLSHNCDLIFHGIPREAQELKTVFNDISKSIGCSIDHNATASIFRLPSNNVMVKFLSTGTKQMFFSQYLKHHNLNLSHIGYQGHSRVYINECLCKQTAMLLKIANTMRKDGWIAKTYTKNGFLYIRKSTDSREIRITSKNQLLSSNTSG